MNFLGGLVAIFCMFLTFAAWATHIFVCLTAGKWGFLIAGALFVPIGVIHGFLIWIGAA